MTNTQTPCITFIILGEKRGIVKQTSDLVEGKLNIGEGFDVVAGQTMIAAGGALGAKSFTKKSPSTKVGGYRKLCKRSIIEEPQAMLYNEDFNHLPQNLNKLLPNSFSVSLKLTNTFFVFSNNYCSLSHNRFLL